MPRLTRIRCSVVFAALGLTGWLAAQAMASGLTFNISAGSATSTLKQFASQAHVQLLFDYKAVQNLKTPAVKGQLTPIQALKEMLEGSGFTFREINDHTIAVMAPGASPTSMATQEPLSPGTDAQKGGKKDSSQDFLVAQVAPGQTSSPASVEKLDQQQASEKKPELQEVIVTGSRIPETKEQQVQPVYSYTREDILQSGETTVANFLNTLPDVSTISTEGDFHTFLGQTTVQLHGLPIGTTLVLLNGRRVESSYFGFFDLSNLPVSAVERIDVLPVGSSAIYGSDALGGAVNIILRTDMNGVEVNTKVAHADETTEKDADVAFGKSWDRAAISFLGSYQNQTELLGTDRAITGSLAGFPANAPSFTVTDSCSPGTVYSLTGQNLPGLNSPDAGIPAGIKGTPTVQDFASTAGRVNLCNALQYSTLVPPVTRVGGLLSAHFTLSASAELFAEVLASHEHQLQRFGDLITASAGFGSTLSASNPYNPFGEAVGISFTYPGDPEAYDYDVTFTRPLVGIRGSVLNGWNYEVTAYTSKDRSEASYPVYYNPSGTVDTVVNALNSSSPATALNPFSSVAPGSAQLLQSLVLGYDTFSFIDEATGAQAVLRGPLLHLPSGAVQTVFGAEYERETQHTFLAGFGEPPLNLARNSYGLFGEIRVPLLANHDQPTTVGNDELLTATLAGRYDHSSDFGGKATWQVGLLWRPTESVSVRGGYSTSYLAPLLQQLSGGTQQSFQGVYSDPFRGGQSVTAPTIVGPNPNLKPETGESLALGARYASRALPGFEVTITGFRVAISNYIASPNPQVLIDYPNLFPGAVERAPPTPQDVQLGYLGAITQINDLYFNYGDLDVAGVDVDAHYAFDTNAGRFMPSVQVADMVKWRSALSPGVPEVSYLSQATLTGPGFAPRWKGTAALGWKLRALAASLTGRYVGSYRDYQDYVPNTNILGNFWLVDLNTRYDFGKGTDSGSLVPGAYLALGAINLLNKQPQFSYGGGFDVVEADLRGRVVYLNAGVKW